MAQLVEQRIRNAWVAGSSPAIGSHTLFRSQNHILALFCGIFVQAECRRIDSYAEAQPKIRLTQLSGISSVGRALASQAEGRGFESRIPLKIPHKHNKNTP